MPADEVVVVYLSEKAYPLAVLSEGIGHTGLGGDSAHIAFGDVAQREKEMRKLFVGDARQEVGLVFYRIDCRGEIFHAVDYRRRGIVAGGGEVELMPPALLEVAELYHFVAHDVGVRRKPRAHGAEGVLHHILPVFLMQRHYLQRQVELLGVVAAHLDILFGRAVAFAVVHPDADVEKVQVMSLLHQSVGGHGAVNAARYKHGCLHCSVVFSVWFTVVWARSLTRRKASMRLSTANDFESILWLPLR